MFSCTRHLWVQVDDCAIIYYYCIMFIVKLLHLGLEIYSTVSLEPTQSMSSIQLITAPMPKSSAI